MCIRDSLRGLDRPEFFQAGIIGTLASLIEVPPAEIPAIEAAFGAASRAIVFADADMAEAALQTLREATQGRASVLASDLLPMVPQQTALLPDGALCWATDVVRATGTAHGLIARLLDVYKRQPPATSAGKNFWTVQPSS